MEFQRVLENSCVRPAGDADAVAGVRPKWVVEPTDEAELARALAAAGADGLAVVPRGGGTKLEWGSPPERIDLVFSTLGLNRIPEHAAGDMTVTVQAGCTAATLQQHVARRGQRLALDPLWHDRATVGARSRSLRPGGAGLDADGNRAPGGR